MLRVGDRDKKQPKPVVRETTMLDLVDGGGAKDPVEPIVTEDGVVDLVMAKLEEAIGDATVVTLVTEVVPDQDAIDRVSVDVLGVDVVALTKRVATVPVVPIVGTVSIKDVVKVVAITIVGGSTIVVTEVKVEPVPIIVDRAMLATRVQTDRCLGVLMLVERVVVSELKDGLVVLRLGAGRLEAYPVRDQTVV